jgi:hypothetical protein
MELVLSLIHDLHVPLEVLDLGKVAGCRLVFAANQVAHPSPLLVQYRTDSYSLP